MREAAATLWEEFAVDITRASVTTLGTHAQLFLSGKLLDSKGKLEGDREASRDVSEKIAKKVARRMSKSRSFSLAPKKFEKYLASSEVTTTANKKNKPVPVGKVRILSTAGPAAQELVQDQSRHVKLTKINSPGHLAYICRVIDEAKYSIDHLMLRPALKNSLRYSVLDLWLRDTQSSPLDSVKGAPRWVSLQARLRLLVGVREFWVDQLKSDRSTSLESQDS